MSQTLRVSAGALTALEDDRAVLGPFPVVIGKNGFAASGEKREGDGKTPSGRFALGTAFGYGVSLATKMPYRRIADDDVWVDDPEAPDYNTWTQKSRTSAKSYEVMRRPDGLYRCGLVIEYNTTPVEKGKGSAIFLHVWRGPGLPTEGCVALEEKGLRRLLGWLEPGKTPEFVLDPP